MATFQRFEDIEAWQDGRALTKLIYQVSRAKAFSRDYSLKDQIRRASTSITSNIAEGFERDSNAEFIYFLSIAKGTAGEVRSLLYTCLDEGYIDQEQFARLYEKSHLVIRKIAGLINYLKRSGRKGKRYKKD